eukprot:XP_783817.3 PREDICTED: DNA repair protein RAD51 homolog 2 [Strongylocentrotus purpuratus]
METDDSASSFSVATSDGGEGHVTTALGNTWSHNVNTRLILQYLDEVQREVLIAKSPLAPFAKVTYTIQDAGLVCRDGDAVSTFRGTDPGLQKIRVRSAISR